MTMIFGAGTVRAADGATALTGAENKLAPGDYCLTGDVTMQNQLVIESGTVNLSLNSHVLTLKTGDSGIWVEKGATLNITDDYKLSLEHSFTRPNTAPYVWTLNETGGDHSVVGGVIYGGNNSRTPYGGALRIDGTVTMNGGNIVGCQDTLDFQDSSTVSGGAVYVSEGGSFDLIKGTLEGNAAWGTDSSGETKTNMGYGGAICSFGKCTIGRGSLDNNTSAGYGGGIYFASDKDDLVIDGSVTHNEAVNGGGIDIAGSNNKTVVSGSGALYANSVSGNGGAINIHGSGNAVTVAGSINGNSCKDSGGGICGDSNDGTIAINSTSEVSYNTAAYGGGISTNSQKCDVTVWGQVMSNVATYGGGLYGASNGGIITVKSGSEVNYNTGECGGGLYVGGGSIAVNYGSIDSNSAEGSDYGSGGGVMNAEGTFMNFGKVTNNTAVYAGGGLYEGLYLSSNTMSADASGFNSGTISGNTAAYGGGVCLACGQRDGEKLTIDNDSNDSFENKGTVTENTASGLGGGIYDASGSLIMDGSPVVKDNVSGTDKKADNVYLREGRTITIGKSQLTNGADIHVTTADAVSASAAQKFATGAKASDASYFTPDSENGAVVSYCSGSSFSPAIQGTASPEANTLWFGMKGAANPGVSYEVHGRNYGWNMGWKSNGETAGTTGQALRIEALRAKIVDAGGNAVSGLGITYQVHVKNNGWMDWKSDGEVAGTTGQSLRIEAVRIKLTGDAASQYSVSYRVHVRNKGWTSWVSDGGEAGTTGLGLRAEAIEIKLTAK